MATTLTAAVACPARAQSAAETAVQAAQQYKGSTITIVWAAGLQSLDPLNFSGPKWKELTGIDVNVVQVTIDKMFTRIMEDYKSGTGVYDTPNVVPAWMPREALSQIAWYGRSLIHENAQPGGENRRGNRAWHFYIDDFLSGD